MYPLASTSILSKTHNGWYTWQMTLSGKELMREDRHMTVSIINMAMLLKIY